MSRDNITYTRKSEFTLIKRVDGKLIIEIRPENVGEFTELVRRACNTWDTDSTAIQEFRDLITVGHIQQSYKK